MKITCDCGQAMKLIPTGEIDNLNRIELVHPDNNQEEIEIYQFRKNEGQNNKNCIAFHCNGCNQLYVYSIEHRY